MKKAFTLFEIVVVIAIIGTMAIFIAPKFGREDLRLAADQIAAHIRYTQHLAMMDDKYDPKDTDWYRSRWQIYFNSFDKKQTYTVFSDQPKYSGNPDPKEIAKNPSNSSQHLTIGHSGISSIKPTPELDLATKYNIETIQLSCGSSNNARIFFDELGRPYAGNQKDKTLSYIYESMLLKEKCEIKLKHKNNSTCTISIEPQTGYVEIENCGRD